MNEKNFKKLQESVIEAGKILRGESKPSREFVYKVEKGKFKPNQKVWAVCVDTDDEELLVPLKLYQVEIVSTSKRVRVIDEAGEMTLAPKEFFLPLTVPQQVEQRLLKVA